jgi:hypothetical protein
MAKKKETETRTVTALLRLNVRTSPEKKSGNVAKAVPVGTELRTATPRGSEWLDVGDGFVMAEFVHDPDAEPDGSDSDHEETEDVVQ